MYEMMNDRVKVSETLYAGGVIPIDLYIREANLEQYYMDMAGERNAEHN